MNIFVSSLLHDGGSGNAAKDAKMRGLYEYVNLLKVPSAPSQHVKYMLLVELARIFVELTVQSESSRNSWITKLSKSHLMEIEGLVLQLWMILLEWIHQSVDAQGSVRDALLSLADSLESDPDSVRWSDTGYFQAQRMPSVCITPLLRY